MQIRIKLLSVSLLFFTTLTFAQQQTKDELREWFHADEKTDGYRGVSTEKAYELLKGRKTKTVIVAVIDSGVEVDHEDLEGNIWVNKGEKPGNGKDDDKNGYVDDITGWDFIGGADGTDVKQDSYELTRLYAKYKKRFEGKEEKDISKKEKKDYEYYLKLKKDYKKEKEELDQMKSQIGQIKQIASMVNKADEILQKHLGKETYTMEDIDAIESDDEDVTFAKEFFTDIVKRNGLTLEGLLSEIGGYQEYIDYVEGKLNYGLNLEFDPRDIVGDDYSNKTETGYGNNEVEGPDAEHGTHVSGIIAAMRDNDLGIKGIATDVKIMVLRAVPDGDERDKDVANAIRYAADNGAHIINMSFGKSYSPYKSVVDDAVRYAEQKGVLLIHAAGNDGENIDDADNFPTDVFLNNKVAPNWIEVGASSFGEAENFVGDFSNYGVKNVDIFAPGVEIYSSIPDSKYKAHQGTSMAAPVVAGVAALLKSYFPDLSAQDLKRILMESSIKYDLEVTKPGSGSKVNFKELSVSGGIVNAYSAVKMALEETK